MKTIKLGAGATIRAGLDPDPDQGKVIELTTAGGMHVAVWLDEAQALEIAKALMEVR